MRFPFGLVIIFISWIISANMKQKNRRSEKQDFSTEQNKSKSLIWHKNDNVLREVFSDLSELKEQFFGESEGMVSAKENFSSKQEIRSRNSSELIAQEKETNSKKNMDRKKQLPEESNPIKQENLVKPSRKRTRLQKAIIYSEVIGKPKSLR